MKILRRTISRSTGGHIGIWRQQPGWIVVDLWRYRFEFIRN